MHDDVSKAAPTEAESDVSASKKAASADLRPEDIRVAEYAILRREAEVGFAARLPANPRRAKRMINHHRLLATIAEDRQVFGGEPLLDHHHLAKWVLIVEHWPGLGITLTSTPSKIEALEGVASTDELLAELMSLGRERHDLEELLAILQGPPRLSPVLGRLVRFEPIASAADGDITGEVAETRE